MINPAMKRRLFLHSLAGAAVLGSVTFAAPVSERPTTTVPPLEGPLFATPVAMLSPRADGLDMVCGVKRLVRGWVEWKTSDGASGRCAEDGQGFIPQGDSILRVRVAGLEPGKEYQLRMVAQASDGDRVRQESPWRSFRPLNAAAATTRFCVWNDTHQWFDTIARLHEVTPACDFLVWNGDTCNNWNEKEWLTPTLLHPGGKDVTAERPLHLVYGNHDVRGKWAFGVSERIPAPEGKPYYAFRSGPVAVICLHTGEDKPDDHPTFGGTPAFEPLRREQAAWLKEITQRPDIRDAPYRIVFCHIPLRWTKEPDVVRYDKAEWDHYARTSRDLWHDVLVEWGAQAVISGHNHRHHLLPATEQFPYAQLLGGGNRPNNATVITGEADANGLILTCSGLDGAKRYELPLKPLR